MTYDCFSFYNELDTLEIRLNTLKDAVDKFVLVETSWTHTGRPKDYVFESNRDRFKPFLDRIIHVKLSDADLPPLPADASEIHRSWIRENTQRNAIAKGLAQAEPDDVLIISDLDEIPSPESIKTTLQTPTGITNVAIRNYSFWLNNANASAPYHYRGPRILTAQAFFDPNTYANAAYNPCAPREANPIPSATLIRFAPETRTIFGGWHFSSQGNVAQIKDKFNSIADGVFVDKRFQNDNTIAKQIKRGNALNPGVHDVLVPEPLSHDFPTYIVENQARFSDQLLPATEESWRKSARRRRLARLSRILHDRTISLLIQVTPKRLHPVCRKIRRLVRM